CTYRWGPSRRQKERAIRSLIVAGKLEHVMIGCRIHIPEGAFERFVDQNKVIPCLDGTRVQDSSSIVTGQLFTSAGPRTDAAVSAALARQTARKLKSSSPTGSNSETKSVGQVIRLKS